MSNITRSFSRLALRRGNMRNGLYPNAATWITVINAMNHSMGYRHREVYRRAWELGQATGVFGSGTNTIGRFRFRTGHGVTTLTYVVMIGLDNTTAGPSGGLATNPYIEIDTTISGGATTTRDFHYGLQSSPPGTDAPDETHVATSDVSVTPLTVYEVEIKSVDYARPIAIVAYEQASQTVTESTNYYNLHQPQAGSPIYDANRQRMALGLSEMWRTMGGATWHWHLQDGAARTRSSATYVNILDNSTTGTPATSDYGFYLDLTSHNTISATTAPMELAVYGSIGAGSGTVRLIDSAGNTYGPVTINGAAGWYTATVNLPASSTFYTAQYAGDGANTVSVSAISLIEYTA